MSSKPNPEKPDVKYELEHVYGCMTERSLRKSAHYNAQGHVVYVTASVGVINNVDENS